MVRPFTIVRDNIIEVLNDSVFLFFCITLMICNSENDWSPSLSEALIIILMMNGFFISLIMIIDLVINCVKKRRQSKKNKVAPFKQTTDTDEQEDVLETQQRLKNDHSESHDVGFESQSENLSSSDNQVQPTGKQFHAKLNYNI